MSMSKDEGERTKLVGAVIEYARPGLPKAPSRVWLWIRRLLCFAIIGGGIVVGGLHLLAQKWAQDRQAYGLRLDCDLNLRQIGEACGKYAEHNRWGRMPDSLDQVLLAQNIKPDVFVCPATKDVPAVGPTTQ